MCATAMEQELKLAEVATRLNISVQTVMRHIKAGRIKARKEGQEWRVTESELRRYIKSTYPEQRDTSKRDTDKHPIIIPPLYGEELRG